MYRNTPLNIVIVGGNAAGPAAAAKAKRINPDANIILFEAGQFISTGTCELPYVLSGEIDDYNKIVFYTPETFESEKGVKVYTKHRVERIDTIKKTLTVRNLLSDHLVEFPFDKLILCTGSQAKKINNFSDCKNVFTLKTVSDLISIKKYISDNRVKKAAIFGGGYIGVETADALQALNCEVLILDKEKLPMPQAELETRKLIGELLKKNNIEFHGSSYNPKVFTKEQKVYAINIEGWQREVDIVIEAIGFEPNVQLAKAIKIDIGPFGGIKTDQRMKTSNPNIYAAGDCVEVINQITGRPDYFPLATIARETGYVAAENAAGGNAVIKPYVKNIAVKFCNHVYVSVGLSSMETEKNRFTINSVEATASNLVKVMPNAQNVFGKIIFEKGSNRILGANFLGSHEVIGYGDLIALMIKQKIKVTDLAEINYNYTPPESPFVNILYLLAKKSERGK